MCYSATEVMTACRLNYIAKYFFTMYTTIQEVSELLKHILDELENSNPHLAGCMEQVRVFVYSLVLNGVQGTM